jgi:hypothetical protein
LASAARNRPAIASKSPTMSNAVFILGVSVRFAR